MARRRRKPPGAVPTPETLAEVGRAAGLDAVGFCRADPFEQARDLLEQRKAAGLHGGMGFTYRQPGYSTTPSMALRDARSIVVGAFAYRRQGPDEPTGHGPTARVASYAWEEYYLPLKRALTEVGLVLRAEGWRTRVVVDDNAMVDRAAAVRAGLGWYGKSSNVLLPGVGSWFVLGSLITDAPVVEVDPEPVSDGCGPCTRCIDLCPTAAIVAPGVVDARRCLSWVLQDRGVFPVQYRAALGSRIYGCDDCQEVCPPNRLDDRRSVRPTVSAQARPWVAVLDMLEADDAALLAAHDSWFIPDRDPRYLRRNALVVLANVGEDAAHGDRDRILRAVLAYLTSDDPFLVAHAVWAAGRLGLHDLLSRTALRDDPLVADELARWLQPLGARNS